jgi:serine/threonine protein kinase
MIDDRILDLLQRWEDLRDQGQHITPEKLCQDSPELLEEIKKRIQDLARVPMPAPTASDLPPTSIPDESAPPSGDGTIGQRLPAHFGRYRMVAKLGAGGFGVVYKGYDDDLRRDVAIKVPHRKRVAAPEDIEAYLAEARIVAALDHPGIVPVYDMGRTEDGLCYLVSKFVEGSDLACKISQDRLPPHAAAEMVARIAEALHHAHQRGLVHRDIKPANILLDAKGQPYVTDFGLALRDEDFGKGPACAGTPGYMSPEQARAEGHRVDGRTDVFSLGVVFYELLTGTRPFRGDSIAEIFEQIKTLEARPPRQIDDTIPKELDRICLKALAKRASDRYSTAFDLADDLRHWLTYAAEVESSRHVTLNETRPKTDALSAMTPPQTTPTPTPVLAADFEKQAVKVIPKGLRSYDAADADFFLELLPGPRDRDGLPESIRFWKTRIEETDPDKTFSVGLIYGPSGCGKSSLVKAGLLPHLAEHIISVYTEATSDETETRLLKSLRRRCSGLPSELNLVETLAHLRRTGSDRVRSDPFQAVPDTRDQINRATTNPKVLIVLDQFEQWLHAKREEQHPELVEALRQCDGEHVQCIVMIRDDFWLAATRFMGDLEVRLIEGHNTALVDLFGPAHAKKVLTEFGRAFGCLPNHPAELRRDQSRFIDQAVAGLAEDGKVISVRLSLFVEMVKNKPWTPATLKEVGGAEGIGITFLEETFSAKAAPPEHRLHQKAARAILKALLPEQGSDLKGHMRSHQELMEISGYANRPIDFGGVILILDTELRLMTPTAPDENGSSERQNELPGLPTDRIPARRPDQYYQLTHDYLVPALATWLTRKQKETIQGRAYLRLAQRAALWKANPNLIPPPGLWETLNIRLLTRKRDWTALERKMMAAGHTFPRWLRICGWVGSSLVFFLLLFAAVTQFFLPGPPESLFAVVSKANHKAGTLIKQPEEMFQIDAIPWKDAPRDYVSTFGVAWLKDHTLVHEIKQGDLLKRNDLLLFTKPDVERDAVLKDLENLEEKGLMAPDEKLLLARLWMQNDQIGQQNVILKSTTIFLAIFVLLVLIVVKAILYREERLSAWQGPIAWRRVVVAILVIFLFLLALKPLAMESGQSLVWLVLSVSMTAAFFAGATTPNGLKQGTILAIGCFLLGLISYAVLGNPLLAMLSCYMAPCFSLAGWTGSWCIPPIGDASLRTY